MTPPADPARYKNHRFPGEIISHGVWLYYRFPLSYRDVQEILCERGIDVTRHPPVVSEVWPGLRQSAEASTRPARGQVASR